MSDAITGVMRILHVVSAVFWVGGAALWSMVIAPRVLARGPPGIRRPFAEAAVPGMTRFLQINAILALVSGFILVGMIWGWDNYDGAFQTPTYGPSLSFGVFMGLGMAIVGFGFAAPTGKKLIAAMQAASAPPTPEQQAQLAALGKRLGMLGMVTITLGTLALIGMVWAVNNIR